MYFKDSQILLLHPTKTGGSTVEHLLMGALKDSLVPHDYMDIQRLNEDGPEDNRELKRNVLFGSYKDPLLPRVISLQHACITTARRLLGDALFAGAKKVATVRNPYARLLSQYFYYPFHTESSFPDFVRDTLPKFIRTSPGLAVNFAARQTLYTHQHAQPVADFIVRQERMSDDLQGLSQFLGVPVANSRGTHLRKSKASAAYANYMDAYDETSRAVVQDLYADDFALLGYDP